MHRLSSHHHRCLNSWAGSACLILSLLLGWVGASQAEDAAPAAYSEAIKQAIQELEANHLPESLAEFRRAHELFPNARSLRGIGMVEFDLRDYQSSVHHLQEALASHVKPLSGSMRAETEALLERARRYLGELRIMTDPEDASILVDGSPALPRSDGTVLLNPGDHVIEASAAGRLTETRTVQVSGGDQRQVMISLRMVQRAPQPDSPAAARLQAPSSDAPHSERQPAYRKWWVWTLVAVAVAGGGTTAAILLTRHDHPAERPVTGTNTVGVALQALSQF